MFAATAPLSARNPRVSGGTVGLTPRTKNPLLVKDEVGRGKPTCYDLPDGAVPYGRPGNQDYEGAREVSMHWVSHVQSAGPVEAAPDFIRLHQKAAQVGVRHARDLTHFRRAYEGAPGAPRASGSQSARGAASRSLPPKPLVPSDVIPGFTYGRKVRPSTPIQEVISYRFGEKAEMDLQAFNERFQEHKAAQESEIRKIPLTQASRGHASTAKKAAMQSDDRREHFKLSKFTRAKPQVDTGLRKPPRYQFSQDPDHPSWDPRPIHGLANDYDDQRAGRDSHALDDSIGCDFEREVRGSPKLPA